MVFVFVFLKFKRRGCIPELVLETLADENILFSFL